MYATVTDSHGSSLPLLDELVSDAITSWGASPALAAEIAEITLKHFRGEAGEGRVSPVRVRAYFRGVMRNKAIRSRGAELKHLRSRCIRQSIVADLMAGGIAAERVVEVLGSATPGPLSR